MKEGRKKGMSYSEVEEQRAKRFSKSSQTNKKRKNNTNNETLRRRNPYPLLGEINPKNHQTNKTARKKRRNKNNNEKRIPITDSQSFYGRPNEPFPVTMPWNVSHQNDYWWNYTPTEKEYEIFSNDGGFKIDLLAISKNSESRNAKLEPVIGFSFFVFDFK